MTNNGAKLIDRWKTWVVALAVILPTLFAAFGVRESLQTLQDRVDRLEVATAQIDEIEARIMELQREAAQIAHIRRDVLEAICAATVRNHDDVRRCFRALPS